MKSSSFFDSLIDDFGIWQHTDGTAPMPADGYALDDATRGLIACLLLEKFDNANVLFDYIVRSCSDGQVYGFATDKREYIGEPASEDATGQIVWAMGMAVDLDFRADEARALAKTIHELEDNLEYVRGLAYTLLGAAYLDKKWARRIAKSLAARFKPLGHEWYWPEERLTYGNGIIPYSLLRYGLVTGDTSLNNVALKNLKWLDERCRLSGILGPIGHEGWRPSEGAIPPLFSQQPIDAAYMVWACAAAYEATGEPRWKENMVEWQAWFDGKNITGLRMYNPENGQCFDGIDDHSRVSRNSGAESNICFMLSTLVAGTGQTF